MLGASIEAGVTVIPSRGEPIAVGGDIVSGAFKIVEPVAAAAIGPPATPAVLPTIGPEAIADAIVELSELTCASASDATNGTIAMPKAAANEILNQTGV
jgi:hypothetical protein